MHYFHYVGDEMYCEDVPLTRIAEEVGTPSFVYSRRTLERHFRVFQEPFRAVDHLVCYSMKACSNIAVLRLFANLGGGVDIVSGGELFRAQKAGIDPQRIVYSGVGKTAAEMDAALDAGILMFNVESEEELELLDSRARAKGMRAPVSIRVNPDVDPLTHPKISTGLKQNKFGIDKDIAKAIYRRAKEMDGIEPIGVDCHIGSQLTNLDPFLETVERLHVLISDLRADGIDVRYLDIGGGLGIPYELEQPPSPEAYGKAIVDKVKDLDVKLIMEPGRVIVGNAGIVITRVLFRKEGPEKHFVIIDAGMNDLMRPTLYNAYHAIRRVSPPVEGITAGKSFKADLVGPICETGDYVAQGREIDAVHRGDLIAVMSSGAYGFSMSSNYNSRPRAAEVLVDGSDYVIIRERETYEDLIRGEHIPAGLLERM